MGATIVITRPGKPAETRELTAARTSVGREVGDIVTGDGQTSSRHAELLWDGVRLTVKDLGSTNGTFVGGARVSEQVLSVGDVVKMGTTTVRFESDGAPAAGRTIVAMPAMRPETTTQPLPEQATAPPAAKAQAKPAKPSGKPGNNGVLFALGGVAASLLAVAIGVAVVMRGGGGAAGGGAESDDGEAVVNAVWYRGGNGTYEGGTSPITVRISKNKSDGASVGFIEEFVGGTGDMWRTATWVAAFNASRVIGSSLIDHEYVVRSGGHIDGPSAGMLMTATMMALLSGETPDPLATMTGTVNPDGSAGPVGGIVQKMKGAKEKGIKRFGYPMGARNHTDLSTNATVDLEAKAAEEGLTATEIHDVYEAYTFLTGKTLARPTPVDEAAMALDADTSARLRAKVATWMGRIKSELPVVEETLKKNRVLAQSMGPMLKSVNDDLQEGQRYEQSDLPAAAFTSYVSSVVQLMMAREGMAFVQAAAARDNGTVNAMVAAARATSERIKAFEQELIVNSKKKTVGGQVNATRAFVALVQAQALASLAEQGYQNAIRVDAGLAEGRIKPSAEATNYIVKNLLAPVLYFRAAGVLLDAARDEQDLVGEEGGDAASSVAELGREAGAYGSAAGAALSYFDAIVVAPQQEQLGVTTEQMRAAVGEKETVYNIARREVIYTESLRPKPDDMGGNLLRLAAGIDAYLNSSSLVNKYYALGATEAEGGKTLLTQRKALTAQLEQARLHARESAARAQAVAGFVPVSARMGYQLAGALREGDDDDKLSALRNYWASAAWSDLAAKLAKKAS